MALAVTHDLAISSTEHVAGVRNIVCDSLSREGSYSEHGFHPAQCFDLAKHPLVERVLLACNPLHDLTDDDAFYTLWLSAQHLAAALAPTGDQHPPVFDV